MTVIALIIFLVWRVIKCSSLLSAYGSHQEGLGLRLDSSS